VDYTGGLQEGGPKRIENLVSVTSYPPNPAARAPCTSPAAALPSRQTSPIRRQLIRFLTGWTRWECRVPLREICTTAGAAGMSARKDSWSSCMIIWALRTAPVQEMCIDSSFLASMSAMGSLVLGPSKKVLVNPRGVSQIVANTFFNMDTLRRCSRTVGFGFDDRQQVLAVPVCLRRTETLHFDQLPDAAGSRLGNGDQCGVGEHTVRGKLLISRLLAPPLTEHRHRVIIECRRATQVAADLALGSLAE
jgi:hypothetical protein